MSTSTQITGNPRKELNALLTQLQQTDFTSAEQRPYKVVAEDRELGLTEEQAGLVSKCIVSIHSALPEPDAFQPKDVRTIVEKVIVQAVQGTTASPPSAQKRLQNAFRFLEEQLNRLSLWEVHQPIEGLENEDLPATFGNITFYWADDQTLDALLDGVKNISRRNAAALGQEDPPDPIWQEGTTARVKGHPFCKVVVKARSSQAALNRALHELALTIDVANFFSGVSDQMGSGARLYLPGEARETSGSSFAFRLPEAEAERSQGVVQNSEEAYTSHYIVGPFSTFPITRKVVESLAPLGWGRASEILAKERTTRTVMEERILAAMRWAGRATVTELRDQDKRTTRLLVDQAFLLYAIALESLLLKKESELSYRLSLRGAHLLGNTTTDREKIQQNLVELYDLRSRIVHSGSSSVTPEQLRQLRFYAKDAIFTMLSREPFNTMSNEKDLHNWFNRRLLE